MTVGTASLAICKSATLLRLHSADSSACFDPLVSSHCTLQQRTWSHTLLQPRASCRAALGGKRKNQRSSTADSQGAMYSRCGGKSFDGILASDGVSLGRQSRPHPVETIIQNSAGEKLVGLLEDMGTSELCILCHGFRSSKGSGTLAAVSAALVGVGVSTFRFDFSGNGESEGSFSYGNYWKEAEDLRSVILYFRAQGRSISTILGHSKGGSVVLLYASRFGDVAQVVNVCGRFNLQAGMKERLGEDLMDRIRIEGQVEVKDGADAYLVTKAGLEDRLSTDMPGAAKSISKKCRVLTIHGALDKTVPVTDAYNFDKVVANHQLKVIDDGDHNFRNCKQELVSAVLPFALSQVN